MRGLPRTTSPEDCFHGGCGGGAVDGAVEKLVGCADLSDGAGASLALLFWG